MCLPDTVTVVLLYAHCTVYLQHSTVRDLLNICVWFFQLYISVRLTLSDTSTNVTYKSLSGTEHVPKSGTYCTQLGTLSLKEVQTHNTITLRRILISCSMAD